MQIPHIRDYQGGHIHMIGIGGSSMSGLAGMLMQKGYKVTGSDQSDGYLLQPLRDMGATIYIGQKAENVEGADLVVYTAAIAETNPERAACAEKGIPTLERAWLLGQLMEGSEQSVGISGAHGKTSTTSMLSQILVEGGLDPSIHIGGQLDAIGGSTRIGKGGVFLAEACEFKRSFLKLRPTVAVILNIDADHLDCYKDIDEIEQTFGEYLDLLPADGLAIGNGDDARVLRQLKACGRRYETFGLAKTNDWYPANLERDESGCASFDLAHKGETLCRVTLNVPGDFNLYNALAALASAHALGADMDKAAESMASFRGAHRRFELTGMLNGCEMFHDYGHNPTEMRNAVSIARMRCKGTLYAVMQPHTFSRVKTLFDDYLTCTEKADVTLVTDICAAREVDPGDINSGMLVDGMRAHGVNAVWTPSFDDTEAWLREHVGPGDLAITMGCGDINRLNDQIEKHEREK